MKGLVNIFAAIGLAFGAVFGMAGTLVSQPNLQALLWAVDGAGLVMASALLALKYSKIGRDLAAAGFLVFAIAEGVILSGTAAGPVGSVPSFATGLWATALVLISIPRQFTLPFRLSGLASAVLFAVTAALIFWGEQLLPTSAPLPFYAYPLVITSSAGFGAYYARANRLVRTTSDSLTFESRPAQAH